VAVATDEAQDMARRLAREEALFAGTSSGANVVAALRIAERLGAGATIVTLMADSGLKYQNTDVYRKKRASRPLRGSETYPRDSSPQRAKEPTP
jgi:cysteine synthase A